MPFLEKRASSGKILTAEKKSQHFVEKKRQEIFRAGKSAGNEPMFSL
jgi:hypothetical protein